ncbi:hypothetical protein MJO28_000701 [Puccinia striiformis f. sp. tritici]|uniref:Uncharacterized protein n=3 Tax=Puccinia striiformis TaxID=27350 RepID=A0A0L0V327_9BASI|nr:hypothetical protein MJO28_000701 [Puccinia striiformis f. sp. tritici]KAI9601239.1 hypothetical protein H4Q26_001050 [Puccinia striiformis f. sp. tritici PST-130]KAI9602053.1 hypothetical protein KEM48_001001 [Puccinia striiformis f. sp. tritici PST-130]KNE93384.1 hypothetical protein PSTG_13206 [Puccinia striiformis f. sp. tritici PST-78]POW15952.1 hypothetical protein PSHT_06877 [Puccinia striiformis]
MLSRYFVWISDHQMCISLVPNFPAPRADLSFLCRGGYVALCCTRSTTPKNINLGNCEASVGAYSSKLHLFCIHLPHRLSNIVLRSTWKQSSYPGLSIVSYALANARLGCRTRLLGKGEFAAFRAAQVVAMLTNKQVMKTLKGLNGQSEIGIRK